MRVVHAFKDYFPPTRGGIEQHVHEVVHSLDGFEFAVVTSSRSRRLVVEEDAGVRVYRAPEYARPASTPFTPGWARFLRKERADLIHFHMPNPFGEAAYLASRTKTPMVTTYHADPLGQEALLRLYGPVQQRFLSSASRIVVSNPRLLETSAALRPHRKRAVVVPFGVDPGQWEPRPPLADQLRHQYPGPLVLFLGRLVHYKGLQVAIEATRGLEATLLIVGEGRLCPNLFDAAASAGVLDRVIFVGQIPDNERAAYYHAADVFVLPATSRAETFGIAMLEAMACGTPAVSTELGTGTSWLNVDGMTGFVVRPGDVVALNGALKRLLDDPDTRGQLGEMAATRVRHSFTKKAMLDGLAEVYRSAI